MAEYCKNCGQQVAMGMGAMFAQSKPVKFEDGFYCENCAKVKVARARQ